jgi:hypothetical protein
LLAGVFIADLERSLARWAKDVNRHSCETLPRSRFGRTAETVCAS